MRVAVVGHVEWLDFVEVERMPSAGEIARALDHWEEPAGGGPVAAVQLAKLAGSASLFTVLGADERGGRARAALEAMGLQVHAAMRGVTRRAVSHLDRSTGERQITVIGERLAPSMADPLPWDDLAGYDAVYLCAADAGAIRAARRAGVLVATVRTGPSLREASVELDALVGSARDAAEGYDGDLEPPPRLVAMTEGGDGGWYAEAGHEAVRFRPEPLPGAMRDAYGCGDSFAAGLAFALGRSDPAPEAVRFAAFCGAAALTGRGPYAGQARLEPPH